MEDSFKSIRLMMDYFDEDGKRSVKEMTIKVNKPKDISEKGFIFRDKKKYAMTFSMVIPEHIHSFIIGKDVPDKRSDKLRHINEDMPKTINCDSVEGLCNRYQDIIDDYYWLKKIEKQDLQAVIFYNFNNTSKDFKSGWNNQFFGAKCSVGFTMSVGYIANTPKGVLRYNRNKEYVSDTYNKDFYSLNYVVWSEERELFFDNIKKVLDSVVQRVDEFNSGLSEQTIDDVISKGGNLLPSQSK